MTRKLLTGLSAAALSLTMGVSAHAQQAAIGTLPQGALGYAIAAGVANVITQNSDIAATAVPTGGSNVVLPQVNSGEMEFGTSNTVETVYAGTATSRAGRWRICAWRPCWCRSPSDWWCARTPTIRAPPT